MMRAVRLQMRSFHEKRKMQMNGWNGLFSESREQPTVSRCWIQSVLAVE